LKAEEALFAMNLVNRFISLSRELLNLYRIAKLKGNKILVQLNAAQLPKSALRYIIAHEIAHTLQKDIREDWKVVEKIYPNFEIGQNLLMRYGSKVQARSANSSIL